MNSGKFKIESKIENFVIKGNRAFTLLLTFYCQLFTIQAFSQSPTNNEQLAYQYYADKEYDKALVYYKMLYANDPSNNIYHNYLDCLEQTKDFKTAEKVIKHQLKLDPNNCLLYVDMGTLEKALGNDKQAKEYYNKAINKLPPDKERILELGSGFMDLKEWDYALETYKKGKALLNNSYPFLTETGEVYSAMGNTAEMIDSYFETLVSSPDYLQYVQDALQLNVGAYANETQNNIVKTELLKYIQKYPGNDVFAELYVWMMLQLHNYPEALVQAKALDRRRHEGGDQVMRLARTCEDAGEYDAAIDAYQYVMSLGSDNFNYIPAKIAMLNAQYQKLVNKGAYTYKDLIALREEYQSALHELPGGPQVVSLMINLAHIDGFYLRDDSDAVVLMQAAINMPGAEPLTQARCRMELADILLESGKIWEASLDYGKIDNDFKQEAIGDEAKFKNAEIYYYTGNFKWAKAALDILKAATAKLTANDAMALSLLVADNTQDSSKVPALALFAHAQLLEFQNYDDSASRLLDSVYDIAGTTTLKEEVLMTRAKIAEKRGKFDEAANYYIEETKDYPAGMLPDKALFYLARMEDYKVHDLKKAADYYKQIILQYPGSFYIDETRERYRQLVPDSATVPAMQ